MFDKMAFSYRDLESVKDKFKNEKHYRLNYNFGFE